MAFLVEVDPGQRIAEADEANNRAVSRTRFVPRARVVVFPSPFRPARDQALRFMGVPLGAEVRIYGPTGALVWAAREDDSRQRRIGAQPNEVVWLGVNGSGDSDERAPLVAGGVYFYTIRSQAGELLRRDRIAVVR
jgi:hypothetical protein